MPKDRDIDPSSAEPAFLSDPVAGPGVDVELVPEVFLRSDKEEDEPPVEGSAEVRLCPTPPSGGKWNVSIANRFLRTLNPRLLTPLLDPPLPNCPGPPDPLAAPSSRTESFVDDGMRAFRTGTLCTWKRP